MRNRMGKPAWPSPASPVPAVTRRPDVVQMGKRSGNVNESRMLAGKKDETLADAGLLHTRLGYHRKTRVPCPASRSRTTIEVTCGQLSLPSEAKSSDVNTSAACLLADFVVADGPMTIGRG